MIKVIQKNNYLVVHLILIALVNLFLLTLPLTNVFGYEFSAVNALLISFLSGVFILSLLKSAVDVNNDLAVVNLLKSYILMLLIPFTISIIKSIVTGFCSFWDGFWFYLVITIPSVIIGGALGCLTFFHVRKFKIVVYIILYLLILFIPVLEIYFNPQIYLYNPLFAYFPGTIYDEGLVVSFKLFLYRFLNLLFFSFILFYFLKWRKRETRKSSIKFFMLFVIILSIVFYFILSPAMGFTTTKSSLKSYLARQVETEHFVIQADLRISKKDLELIALNQEYFYSQLSLFFKDKPDIKLTSYIFFDGEQKKELFGTENADVAKPWLYSIYISYDNWENTIKHEIAHCFTADFGWSIFKLAYGFNPALIEGAAEAADGFYDENGIDYLASLAYKNNYKINIESLLESFSFFSSVSSLSYIYSGSFVKYLISEYGIDKFKYLYRTNDFEKIYDKNLSTVTKEYEEFLDTLNVLSSKANADYYFGRKPLISKVCPRYISSCLEIAWNYYSHRENLKAEKIFKEILSKADNFNALFGLSKIYDNSDSLTKAIHLLQSYLNTFSGTSNEYELNFRLADLYTKNFQLSKAEMLYDSISLEEPGRRLKLLADSRIALLKEGMIKEYIEGSDFDKYTILKELNSKNYIYVSIPLMINLSSLLDEDYNLFLKNFKYNFDVKDETSSYGVYKISQYSLNNFDFITARKLAGLALRYKDDPNMRELLINNYSKADWFLKNAEKILSSIKIISN